MFEIDVLIVDQIGDELGREILWSFSVSLFLLTNMLIDFCWHATCVEFLTIPEKKVFPCVNCGLRPNVLVIDGIAVGLDRCEDIVAEELADKSKS